MTLPASGTITAAMINVELGRASTAAFNIGGSAERALAGVASGPISFNDFHGKTAGGGGGGSLSVTGTTPGVSGSGSTNANPPGSVTAVTATASVGTVSGGTPPYTYAWEFTPGQGTGTDHQTATMSNPTSASTHWTRTAPAAQPALSLNGLYRCKISDSAGHSIYTSNVNVNTQHEYIP